jgi:hypothetical protein
VRSAAQGIPLPEALAVRLKVEAEWIADLTGTTLSRVDAPLRLMVGQSYNMRAAFVVRFEHHDHCAAVWELEDDGEDHHNKLHGGDIVVFNDHTVWALTILVARDHKLSINTRPRNRLWSWHFRKRSAL